MSSLKATTQLGVSNGPIQFESARKIWPLLELLANNCSLARARKIVETARMLGILLKYPFLALEIMFTVLDFAKH